MSQCSYTGASPFHTVNNAKSQRLGTNHSSLPSISPHQHSQADKPATLPSGCTRGLFGERGVTDASCIMAFLWAGASADCTCTVGVLLARQNHRTFIVHTELPSGKFHCVYVSLRTYMPSHNVYIVCRPYQHALGMAEVLYSVLCDSVYLYLRVRLHGFIPADD